MFKASGNPKIEELSKSCKDRRVNLSDLSAIMLDGKKFCAWCGTVELKGRRYKWCSTECGEFAFAWANPQKEFGLNILLVRQDWKCNICQLSWKGLAVELYARYHSREAAKGCPNFGKEYDYLLMKRLKRYAAPKFKPEVDHIVPIYKGGQALGVDNHQAICYSCHKTKTGKDLSGKRSKDVKTKSVEE